MSTPGIKNEAAETPVIEDHVYMISHYLFIDLKHQRSEAVMLKHECYLSE